MNLMRRQSQFQKIHLVLQAGLQLLNKLLAHDVDILRSRDTEARSHLHEYKILEPTLALLKPSQKSKTIAQINPKLTKAYNDTELREFSKHDT